jgi:hypothetical protein
MKGLVPSWCFLITSTLLAEPCRAEAPTPRSALGPSAVKVMAPRPPKEPSSLTEDLMAPLTRPGTPRGLLLGRSESVATDSVLLQNSGTEALSFSYWNAEGAWTTVAIASGGRQLVPCAKCGQSIILSFHDGKSSKTYQLPTGRAYVFSWAQTSTAWVITTSSGQAIRETDPSKN